jgi:transcription termination factor NusA
MDDVQESAVSWLITTLDIGRSTAWSLVYEGFETLEEIAYVPLSELRETGLEDTELLRVRERAVRALTAQGVSMPGPFG